MNNFYDEIKPVLNKLSELNVFDSLDVVRKYVYASIHKKGKEYIKGVENPHSYNIEIYYADFLILNSIIYSSVKRVRNVYIMKPLRDGKMLADIENWEAEGVPKRNRDLAEALMHKLGIPT